MSPDSANFSRPTDDTDSDRSSPATAGKPLRGQKTTQLSTLVIDLQGPSSSNFSKRARGRPPGSKNKPKPPLVITKESPSAMKPVVLEMGEGSDIIEAITQFARQRSTGISLLSGSGSVSTVTLRHPASQSVISLQGPFHLLSLWGSYMGFDAYSGGDCGGFGITLSGVQGQVFGGVVGGKVVAAGHVIVVAATYMHPVFHSLPAEGPAEEEEAEEPCSSECQMSAEVMPVAAAAAAWSDGGGSTPIAATTSGRGRNNYGVRLLINNNNN